jgi:hypothetical protein
VEGLGEVALIGEFSHMRSDDKVVTKLVEPSIPQRPLTSGRFVVTDLSYARQSRSSSYLLLT